MKKFFPASQTGNIWSSGTLTILVWYKGTPVRVNKHLLKAHAQHHSKPLAAAILFLNSLAVRVVIPIILFTSHFQQESEESEQLFILDGESQTFHLNVNDQQY